MAGEEREGRTSRGGEEREGRSSRGAEERELRPNQEGEEREGKGGRVSVGGGEVSGGGAEGGEYLLTAASSHPEHFTRGSLIQLASGRMKKVGRALSLDFAASGLPSENCLGVFTLSSLMSSVSTPKIQCLLHWTLL